MVVITIPTLLLRINREINADGRLIRQAYSSRLGRYYILSWHDGTVVECNIDLEAYARAHGFLDEWETLEPQEMSA